VRPSVQPSHEPRLGSSPAEHDVNTAWLVRLRWLVWGGNVLLLLWAAAVLSVHLPVAWVAGLCALGLASNLGLWAWQRRGGRSSARVVLGVMLTDTVLQTAYFALTGGPFNPFTALYLVNIVLGTLVLSRAQQWAQLAAGSLGFASLFWLDEVAPRSLGLPNHQDLMRLHLGGMLVAFAVSAAFIVSFMQRVQAALKRRDLELETARKLAALTTLAAGAAHELATPLGTIALASRELELALQRLQVPEACIEDARLVRAQVDRCRDILRGMSGSSGELAGEASSRFAVEAWLAEAVASLGQPGRVRVEAASGEVQGPRRALTQALKNLVKNALEASPARQAVVVRSSREGRALVVEVVDEGAGIAPALLARIGEPFFTTREPGQGMGLGVFLARTLASQLGGSLELDSRAGSGTTARLRLPTA
jgi:two-component system, sensor histidine kinase RegB